ncbi:nucleotidyltransferase domain-containing protein [Virgibacillus sp. 179-BFC.A HS]|uniref:Nucleotidyltransferase domain-containing protein n=1 Tax=Tigheibacillus jepli TaxID=3035914 RepID=A0ABU5CJ86_9BACI|nr:nucleotidyltransferase domain-containing protein [Virgibacillus sp. 179-BFC.A HS]MDY0406366.1 nucleotidyltransferase domain-containing protein [Virgibacillus sp. 179-BFC.A HS]
MKLQTFLNRFVANCKTILEKNLVGIYLHGSAAKGCYQRGISDIDILIVVMKRMDIKTKKALIASILQLDASDPQNKLERSILLQQDLEQFQYPTPFQLHYSEAHKEKYMMDNDYMCMDGLDEDLAAHIVDTRHRGVCCMVRRSVRFSIRSKIGIIFNLL